MAYGKHMIVFGGYDSIGPTCNDLYSLDTGSSFLFPPPLLLSLLTFIILPRNDELGKNQPRNESAHPEELPCRRGGREPHVYLWGVSGPGTDPFCDLHEFNFGPPSFPPPPLP